ncbi:transposase [Streptomyces sp. SD15]
MRPHSERFPEALLSLLCAPEPVDFNSPAVSCDCLAHVYGNAADHLDRVREREGREAEPTAGIIDAQSVRAAATVPAASRGYDGGKKVPDRKRHMVTDTLGLLLVVTVTAANIGDRDAAAGLLRRLRRLHRDLTLVRADGGYTGSLVGWCRDKLALTLEIVKRTDDMEGFVVLPRRWVAERTFAWLMNSRRLARDYETLPATSEAMIRWSMVTRMSRRLARPRAAGRR